LPPALVFAVPALRARFVWWKLTSALLVALVFLAIPLARTIALWPPAALPLLLGVFLTVSAATAFGILSANPKTFIVVFLMYWYIALNDKGESPALDFAGWFGTATPAVLAGYVAAALGLLAAAELFHRFDLERS
jgi:uncharacterized membrane protein